MVAHLGGIPIGSVVFVGADGQHGSDGIGCNGLADGFFDHEIGSFVHIDLSSAPHPFTIHEVEADTFSQKEGEHLFRGPVLCIGSELDDAGLVLGEFHGSGVMVVVVCSGGDGAAVDVGGRCVDRDAFALLVLLFSFEHGQAILELVAVGPVAAFLEGYSEGSISGEDALLVRGLQCVEQATANSFHLLFELFHGLAQLAESFHIDLSLVADCFGPRGLTGYDPLVDGDDARDVPLAGLGGSHGVGGRGGEVEAGATTALGVF